MIIFDWGNEIGVVVGVPRDGRGPVLLLPQADGHDERDAAPVLLGDHQSRARQYWYVKRVAQWSGVAISNND